MAFVHHPRSKPARERPASPTHLDPASSRTSYGRTSHDNNAQDWSIVFPGRVKEKPAPVHETDGSRSDGEASATAALPSDPFGPEPQLALALTLPPLHDGTGRFVGASEPSASPGLSSGDELTSLRSPLSPNSGLYSESVFSITDSHDDADEEVGFGSGSDFESDALASVPSGPSAGRRPRPSRRASRLSAVSAAESSAASGQGRRGSRQRNAIDEASFISAPSVHATTASSLGASRAWSWLSGSQSHAGLQGIASTSASVSSPRLPPALVASRRFQLRWQEGSGVLSIISTSDSEQGDVQQSRTDAVGEEPEHSKAHSAYDNDLASSNLAQSAGLVPGAGPDLLWRRLKRRHRNAAIGRSSKKSNTSQSQSALQDKGGSQRSCAAISESRLGGRRARRGDGAIGSKRAGSITPSRSARPESASTSNKLVRKLLKKLFVLEPEVLDSFLSCEAQLGQGVDCTGLASQASAKLGFGSERGTDLALVSIPTPPPASSGAEQSIFRGSRSRVHLLLDGREIEDDDEAYDAEAGRGSTTPRAFDGGDARERRRRELALVSSPLFDLTKAVHGEERPVNAAAEIGLTIEALSRRRAGSRGSMGPGWSNEASRSILEPTTMEAFQALVNSVIPVPMPFRILGALARSLGWSRNVWTGGHDAGTTACGEPSDADAASALSAEDERHYRYDRLLSAQQAKAWSRQYRDIQVANDQQDDTSMDVPECWRGNEHPALAGDAD